MRARLLATAAGAVLLLGGCGGEEGAEPDEQAPAGGANGEATPAPERGGGGDEGPAQASPAQPVDDEDRISGTIRAVLTDPDSRTICTELVSERLIEEAYGNLQGCLDGRPRDSLATEVEVSAIELDGGTASAVAEAEDGVFADGEIEVELIRSGGRWLVEAMRADVPVGP